jgi:putative ABC transport system permease protein
MIRAALKSLLGRKARLLLSGFSIVLGVAFVVGILMFSDTLNRSFTALFASTVGDVVVQPDEGDFQGPQISTRTLPASLVDELAQLPGAARADGQVQAVGVYVIGQDGKPIGGAGPPSFGGNWDDAPAANGVEGLQVVEGDEPRTSDEVVLDESTAERGGYEIGDRVPIVTSTDSLDIEPTLVGIVGYPSGGSLNGATYAGFDTATAQDLFLDGEDVFNTIWVTARDGVSQEELAEQAAAVLPADAEARPGDEVAEENASGLLEGIDFLTTFLLIFAGIALVVSSYIIVNTFSILVAQRSRELALLRALGASRRQVVGSVLLEAFVVGLVAATLGVGLGVGLAMAIRELIATVGLDLSAQTLILRPRTVVAAYVVGILVTMAAAWLPARRSGLIAPVQALRDDVALPESSLRRRLALGVLLVLFGAVALAFGLFLDVPRAGLWVGAGVLGILLGVTATSPVVGRPFLHATAAAYRRVFGSVGTLAGQNSLRNPRRTTATASALMIGLALAFTVAILGDSSKASVDQAVEENFVGDFVVSSAFGEPYSSRIAERIADVDGVDAIVRERFGAALLDGDPQGVIGTAPQDLAALGLVATDGALELEDRSVLLEEEWAVENGYAVGDRIEVEVPTGKQSWPVLGLFEENPIVFAPILTTVDTLVGSGYPDQDNFVIVFADPGSDAAAVQDRLDAVVDELPVVTVKNQREFAAEQREPIDQIIGIIYVLLVFAVIIAVLGIVNTLALSVIERTREVGLLRAIGMSRRQLRTMIRLESVVIALLGAALGVVLGIVFGVALMYALRDEGLEVISIPVGQLVVFLVTAVVLGVLAAILPARRAARLDVLRAISTD